MQAENWKQVKEILAEVLSLRFSERQKYLEKAEIEGEIRQEVESLLAVEKEADSLMNMSAVEFSKDFFEGDDAANALIGQQVGVYRIVRELGFGGMGAVYLAERADGKFSQRVAVKMLKRELNVEKIRRNFEREKEILATLVHPNIATLIDAGTTADGVPFLVMEYIAGEQIDKFCQNLNLSLPERLKLFNKVCAAVGFAHRNLVVHRDLKPSNILVTANGEPKLLDFGISKLLDTEIEQANTITNIGAMTPEYESPEQMRGESVTTATDIYSLGVVLFKILTGTYPFDRQNKNNGNLFGAINNDEPATPSGAVTRELNKRKDTKSGNEKFSIISPAQLNGDIDNIILKSLSKEPERRYQTVEQFSTDIWRYIDGLPVLARPATFSYRASKFYGRNKISVLAGAFIFIILIVGISIAIRQTIIAREQARIATESQKLAELETERAKTEEEKSKKITAFMSKIISYANPAWYAEGSKFGGNARVIDAVDDLSDKIDTEFAGQADIQSELHHKFTEVYNMVKHNEKNPARAEDFKQKQKFHALRAYELRRQFYGEWHELVAKDLFYANGYLGKNEQEQLEILAEAIQMMRETNPNNLNLPYMLEAYSSRLILPDTPETYEPYRKAAIPPTDKNKFQIAERYLREAITLFRSHYKEDNNAIYGNECILAYALAMQEKWTDFDEHFRVCKQTEEQMQRTKLANQKSTIVELVEKVLAEKNYLR